MTTTMRRIALGTAAGLLAIGVGAGAFVHAQDQTGNPPERHFRGGGPGGRGGPGGPMGMLPMFGRELNLTDAQRTQIKAIADAHKDEWKALFDREREARQGLNAAITADTVDEGLIRQKSAETAIVDADIAIARAKAHAQMLQILTPDQKAQLKALGERSRAGRR
jgi:periplasmic protein CpxP/Spy